MADDQVLNFVIKAQDASAQAFKELSDNIGKGAKASQDLEQHAQSLGGALSGLREIATRAFGILAGTAFLHEAISNYSGLEEQINSLGRAAGVSGEELAVMSNRIMEVSEKLPMLDNDLLKVAQTASQFGMKGQESLAQFTKTVAEAAMMTKVDADTLTSSLMRMQQTFDGGKTSAESLAQSITLLGAKTVGGARNLLNLSDILTRGLSSFKISSNQVLALASAMSSMGGRAQMTAMTVSRMFANMEEASKKGGPALSMMARAMGMSTGQAKATIQSDPAQAFQKLVQGLAAARKAGTITQEGMQALHMSMTDVDRVVVPLAGHLGEYKEKLSVIADEARKSGDYQKLLAHYMELLSTKTQELSKAFDRFWAAIGSSLAPGFIIIIDAFTWMINAFTDGFSKLPGWAQQAVAWGAVIGPVILGLIPLVKLLLASLNPITLTIAGITVAVTAGIAIWGRYGDTIRDGAGAALSWLDDKIQSVLRAMYQLNLIADPDKDPHRNFQQRFNAGDDLFNTQHDSKLQAAMQARLQKQKEMREAAAKAAEKKDEPAAKAAVIDMNKAQQQFGDKFKTQLDNANAQMKMYRDLTASGKNYGLELEKETALLKAQQEVAQHNMQVRATGQGQYLTLTDKMKTQIKQTVELNYVKAHADQDMLSAYRQFVEDYTNAAKNWGKNIADIMKTATQAVEDALVSWAQTGKFNAKQMVSAILTEVLRLAVIRPLLSSLLGPLGSSVGGMFGLTKNADGNVFRNGDVVPFAQGGVVSRPTLFPMAGGKTGLMGERGDEAVMPLTRLSNGRLGVQSQGGTALNYSSALTINAGQGGAQGFGDASSQHQALGKTIEGAVRATVMQVIERESRPNGMLRGAFAR